MATPINLDKKIQPGEDKQYQFRINLTIGELNAVSNVFTLNSIKAAPRMSKIDSNFNYDIVIRNGDTLSTSRNWYFDRFQVRKSSEVPGENESVKYLQIRIPVLLNLNFEFLKKNADIKFQTSTSNQLNGIDNFPGKIFSVRESIDKNSWIVSIQLLKRGDQNPWNQMNSSGKTLNELKLNTGINLIGTDKLIVMENERVATKNTFEISMAQSIVDTLIKKISVDNNKNTRQGSVQDIIVYAYEQYDGSRNSKVKRKYLTNGTTANPDSDGDPNVTNDPNELSYEDIKKYNLLNNGEQKSNFEVKFNPRKGKKVIIYATIIRYAYASDLKGSSQWVGEWLQTNQDDQPIWARAVRKESG